MAASRNAADMRDVIAENGLWNLNGQLEAVDSLRIADQEAADRWGMMDS
jgi:hypothetical protein